MEKIITLPGLIQNLSKRRNSVDRKGNNVSVADLNSASRLIRELREHKKKGGIGTKESEYLLSFCYTKYEIIEYQGTLKVRVDTRE